MSDGKILSLSPWFVVETIPRKELFAQENIRRQNFLCYCPVFKKTTRHARSIATVLAPLFPGYLFVHLDANQHAWRSINGTFGVRRFVGTSSGPPRQVPPEAMQAIFGRCSDGVMAKLIDEPRPGDRVRIASGPFVDRLAHIESLDDRGRASVLLDILGGSAAIKVGLDALVAA